MKIKIIKLIFYLDKFEINFIFITIINQQYGCDILKIYIVTTDYSRSIAD
jgi:hypothetical protein